METHKNTGTAPRLQSFILADDVYIDAQTGKKVICGTFNKLWAQGMPSLLGRSTKAYLCLTGCRGKLVVGLKYVDLKDERVLLESPPVTLEWQDPLVPVEVVMDVPPLPMPHPGMYAFEAFCDGERLGVIRVTVEEVSKGDSP